MKRISILLILISCSLSSFSQLTTIIDKQFLANGKLVRLISNGFADENKRYAIEFINLYTNDTVVNYIDSIQHAHCSPLNSVFFINDSTGFITESGGCYASYDWLFRTNDKGKTWKHIKSGSRTFGNPGLCRLNNNTFYMFNESKGIIIWDFENGKLIYSLTSDGGINWKLIAEKVNTKAKINEIQNISYSADGQVTLVCTEKKLIEFDRKKVTIIQSNNFGKSFIAY